MICGWSIDIFTVNLAGKETASQYFLFLINSNLQGQDSPLRMVTSYMYNLTGYFVFGPNLIEILTPQFI